jgi:amino-acid N-acetyltransferase
MQKKSKTIFRKAVIADIKPIQKMINDLAKRNEMLPRTLNQLYENLRDFWVCEADGGVRACCALHIMWEDLAEIRSVAVSENYQGQGIGKKMIHLCLKEARQIGLLRVFLLTYKPDFFKKFGFQIVDKNTLPHKVWTDCINCIKFPDCGEVAMILNL